MALSFLQKWLLLVSCLSFFGSSLGFFHIENIRTKQFSLAADEVSPVASRLFGIWTLLASIVRLTCVFNINERGIYTATMGTFVLALGFYGAEVFHFQSVPVVNAIAPFIIASTSVVWMLATWGSHVGKKASKKKSQ